MYNQIGFSAIVTGFNNEAETSSQANGDWVVENAGLSAGYLYNNKTGEEYFMLKGNKQKVKLK